jgi:putative holliday junction resolvase
VRVLAVDHGTARAGCAISDPTGTIARPLGVVEPPEPRAVAELAAEHEAELVVVGLPVSLSGAEGAQSAAAREFRDALEAILDVPVETYDERLTTRMAEHSARAGASSPPDALAAAHLLESFLQARAGARVETGGGAEETVEE